jgi:aminoglycoside phosphotransferase (APT) family kinase protein
MPAAIRSEVVLRAIPAVFGLSPATCNVRPLGGGLESSVATVSFEGGSGLRSVVVKKLEGAARREIPVYHAINGAEFAPRLYGVVEEGSTSYLFLEHVRAVQSWPWKDVENASVVMRQLARLHELKGLDSIAPDWDYESALLASTAETVEFATSIKGSVPEIPLGRYLSPLRRVAEALRPARLETREQFGTVMLHGDAHPGNVRLRERQGKRIAVFFDWARSRTGSPFEDVSSWLQTLRFWEPAAVRGHDRLLREYLIASGRGSALTPRLRRAYWLSGASNVLAGALRYHLVCAIETKGVARNRSIRQALDGLRVIRRADACLLA